MGDRLRRHMEKAHILVQIGRWIGSSENQGFTESVHTVERQIADIASDESNLEAKIEKKRADLERNQQRLKSLTTVRPAFMDEYEQIEGELRGHYGEYLEKYRNMVYLEHQLDKHMAAEQQEVEEATRNLRRMQERLRQEEAAMMRNGRGGFGPGGGMGNFGGGPGGGKFGPPGHEEERDESSSEEDSSDGDVELGPGARDGSGGGGGRRLDSDDDSLLSSSGDEDVRCKCPLLSSLAFSRSLARDTQPARLRYCVRCSAAGPWSARRREGWGNEL